MSYDPEFHQQVLVILTDVQTKMNSLVGADGTNGRIGTMDERITDLEKSRSLVWGVGGTVAALQAVGIAIVEHFRK